MEGSQPISYLITGRTQSAWAEFVKDGKKRGQVKQLKPVILNLTVIVSASEEGTQWV